MAKVDYRMITGKYYARFTERHNSDQPQPDGDTLRFIPESPFQLFDTEKFQRGGYNEPDINEFGINIRLEAIDALETHFEDCHQNDKYANEARNKLFLFMGFGEYALNDNANPNVVTDVQNNPINGFVISNGIDGNGRLIGFVFVGNPCDYSEKLDEAYKKSLPKPVNGNPVILGKPYSPMVELTEDLLKMSINYKLIEAGMVYPTFYTSLPFNLARLIAEKVKELREKDEVDTLWANESLNKAKSFVWNKKIEQLEDAIMFPKLFRRLVAYAKLQEKSEKTISLSKWFNDKKYARDRNDRLLLPPSIFYETPPFCDFGNIIDILEIDEKSDSSIISIKLKNNPEDIIILPDSV